MCSKLFLEYVFPFIKAKMPRTCLALCTLPNTSTKGKADWFVRRERGALDVQSLTKRTTYRKITLRCQTTSKAVTIKYKSGTVLCCTAGIELILTAQKQAYRQVEKKNLSRRRDV